MDEHQHSEREATEEQHIRETSRAELTEEEAHARLQSEAPDPAAGVNEATASEPNTSADLGSGGGSTTSDPGREHPINPGEGKL